MSKTSFFAVTGANPEAYKTLEDIIAGVVGVEATTEAARDAAITAKNAAENAKTDAQAARDVSSFSASEAQGYLDDALTAETNAQNSASSASTSETNAAASETAAATSETNAAATLDSFEDIFLGTFTTDPTQTTNGTALAEGMLYWNSVAKELRIYNGSTWVKSEITAQNLSVNGGTIPTLDDTGNFGVGEDNPNEKLTVNGAVSVQSTGAPSQTVGYAKLFFDQADNDLKVVLDDGTVRSLAKYFTPDELFASGEAGAWYDPSDLSTLYQDSAGTTAVTAPGDPVGYIGDKSGNGVNATQSTDAARPVYRDAAKRIDLDKTDDNMGIDFGAAFAGAVVQGTPNGTIHMEINVSDGLWSLTQDPSYVPDGGDIIGLVAVEGTPTTAEINNTKSYLQNKGAGVDFAGVASMQRWFRDRSDITAIYSGDWNTSQVTNFENFAEKCSNLTTLDVSAWDTSQVTSFLSFAFKCYSLTTLDVSNWDTSQVTNFGGFVANCESLTTLDVSAWNTSQVTEFSYFARGSVSLTTVTVNGGTGNPFADSGCTDYINAFVNTNLDQGSIDAILTAIDAANTSNGTFDQSGGSAPSSTGETAIDNLRSRGWTVTVTGGY